MWLSSASTEEAANHATQASASTEEAAQRVVPSLLPVLGDLARHSEDLLLIALPASSAVSATPMANAMLPPMRSDAGLSTTLPLLVRMAPGRVWLGVTMPRTGRDRRRLTRWSTLAAQSGVRRGPAGVTKS